MYKVIQIKRTDSASDLEKLMNDMTSGGYVFIFSTGEYICFKETVSVQMISDKKQTKRKLNDKSEA